MPSPIPLPSSESFFGPNTSRQFRRSAADASVEAVLLTCLLLTFSQIRESRVVGERNASYDELAAERNTDHDNRESFRVPQWKDRAHEGLVLRSS